MCGRASLSKVEKELEKRFQATFYAEDLEQYNPLPNYNIAPTHMHPVITSDDSKHLQYFRWGLIPSWAKDPAIGSKMINARKETIREKPAFRQAIQKRRCLIPFDGFYEWKKQGKQKIPHRICLHDKNIFAVAGIWEKWISETGETIFSFSVITQPPNEIMAPIHDRMPAILLPQQESLWLNPELSAKEAVDLIVPYPSGLLQTYTVSKRINKVSENSSDLLDEVPFEDPIQGSLF